MLGGKEMNLFGSLKGNSNTPIKDIEKNDDVKKILDRFIKEDLPDVTAIVIIYETGGGKQRQSFFKVAGYEPAQAILAVDQLHHRFQHEGMERYD